MHTLSIKLSVTSMQRVMATGDSVQPALCRQEPPPPNPTSGGKAMPVPADLPPPSTLAAEADGTDKGRKESSARAPKQDVRPAVEDVAPAKEDGSKAKLAKVKTLSPTHCSEPKWLLNTGFLWGLQGSKCAARAAGLVRHAPRTLQSRGDSPETLDARAPVLAQANGRASSPVTTRLHLGHLTRNVTEEHIQEIFSTFGTLKSVELSIDKVPLLRLQARRLQGLCCALGVCHRL